MAGVEFHARELAFVQMTMRMRQCATVTFGKTGCLLQPVLSMFVYLSRGEDQAAKGRTYAEDAGLRARSRNCRQLTVAVGMYGRCCTVLTQAHASAVEVRPSTSRLIALYIGSNNTKP